MPIEKKLSQTKKISARRVEAEERAPEVYTPEKELTTFKDLTVEDLKRFQKEFQKLAPPDVEAVLALEVDTPVHEDGSAHYSRYLYFLCQLLRPKLCLELGTYKGMTAACMASGNPEGKVITLDIDNGRNFKPVCTRSNLIRKFHEITETLEGIEILFIDTVHDGLTPLREFRQWLPYLSRNSVVFFDDINFNDEMRGFWKNFSPTVGVKFELEVHGDPGFGGILIN